MSHEEYEAQTKAFKKKLIYVTIAACVVILFYFCVQRYTGLGNFVSTAMKVFQPIFIGLGMAFLMNPIMDFFEKHLKEPIGKICKKPDKIDKANRIISALLALVVLVGAVVLFFATAVPSLIDTIVYLVNHVDEQIAGVLDWVNQITGGRYEESLQNVKTKNIDTMVSQAVDFIKPYLNIDQDKVVTTVTNSLISIVKLVVNILIGMFVSVYVLVSKETFKGQTKKLICGILPVKCSNIVLQVTRKTVSIFYGFIIGKIIDSIIIGILCYIGCLIMSMPYPVLVSVIVGVTNVIPVFGPYIGAIPTVIVIFFTEPMKGIYFLIFVLILQQFDGNWLGPKILGDSTGISSFWVLFAVVVGGGLFGLPGMIIGVPMVALIYYLIGRLSRFLVRWRGLPEDTDSYVHMDSIDVTTKELIMRTPEEEETRKHKASANPFKKKKKK